MFRRNRWSPLLVLIPLLLVVGACGESNSPTAPEAEEPGFDLTVMAGEGSAAANADGTYTITLTDVHPRVLAFTDRPEREMYYIEVGKIVALWDNMFGDADGSPNASLTAWDQNRIGETPIALEMEKPVWDAEAGMFAFNAHLLETSAAPSEGFTEVSLFVDPTKMEWIAIGFYCSEAIILDIAAFASADPLAIVAGVGATGWCADAIYDAYK